VAGLNLESVLEAAELQEKLKNIPPPDVEKIFLESVINS